MRAIRLEARGRAVTLAFAAALLFGLTTPAAKLLLARADPWLTAGLFYLGAGVGLGAAWVLRRARGRQREALPRRVDLPWLAAAIAIGGGAGPVLLMFGLHRTPAAHASLLLSLEGVLTAVLAWLVFREHIGARVALGMALIASGALVLAWQPMDGSPVAAGALLIVAACAAWAVDNNLTRKISGGDPTLLAALKGLVAGSINLGIALGSGSQLPAAGSVLAAGLVGSIGYGVSLVLFIRALRDLGAARTGAYFSTAPFLGALASLVALGDAFTARLAIAGACMGVGVWLHVSEHHEHEHVHEPFTHNHLHRHDAHHQHAHEPGLPSGEPHAHPHAHDRLLHVHPHDPDLHHQHRG
jgi:drug/metabolite transporter (DMT)-like permease